MSKLRASLRSSGHDSAAPNASAGLADVQRWLFTYITEPGSREEALAAAEREAGFATGSAERLVLPSPTLAPLERISIYRNMFLLRMEEALETDFPCLQQAVGPDAFFRLVEEYVQVHPSRSWTLNHLSTEFAAWVGQVPWLGRQRAALGELAQLEWALCQVFDAPSSPVLDPSGLGAYPPDRFVDLRFAPIPALRLVASRYPVNPAFTRLREGGGWAPLKRQDSWALVWRDQDYVLWRRELARAEHDLLAALLEGLPLGEAIDRTLRHRRVSGQRLFEWTSGWVASGLFCRAWL